ncbi:hypothetical protein DEU56DRAFT_176124 [Suillus clintonianus]|uniref:uncharacterized protein n=1 Tax=Suillus clintonianus TaxID=1904413 RepID=UPI001B884924|nr:uncharacterized protein DEU56DRAFT_176124 [Suillus clintonianus]KAG2115529.1 hypothetical protein DEU56DRAFT_176124 [Suillus clintonianus]
MPRTLRVVCTVLQILGILLTIMRLGYRVRTRMIWVEDMWAVAALVCGVTSLITDWTNFYTSGQAAIISFWVYAFAYPSTVWAVRQSILFSVARIFWSARSSRLTTIIIAVVFLVLYGALTAQRAWQYGHNLDWYNHPDKNGRAHVYLSHPMVIFELITDCISDVIIISFALRLLWGIKLPAKERIMILAALSTSIIVTIVSIFRAICQLMHFRNTLRIAADLELAVSLITCNLLVATTYIYRIVIRRRNVAESGSDTDVGFSQAVTAPVSRPPVTLDGIGELTTVDLTGYGGDSATQAEPETDINIEM